jgi:hypothetical protein
VNVDVIEERAGDFGNVALDHRRSAMAIASGVPEIAAGTGCMAATTMKREERLQGWPPSEMVTVPSSIGYQRCPLDARCG